MSQGITITYRTLERTIYLLIIIVLAGLLIWSYVGSKDCTPKDETQDTTGTVDVQGGTDEGDDVVAEPEPEPEVIPDPEETCSDDIKNQDEDYPDCGGICTVLNGEFWYDGACHEEEEVSLSGSIGFTVNSIDEAKSPTSDFYKVKEIKFTIDNGKSTKLIDPYIVVYIKSNSGVYLNQVGDGDEYTAYYSYSDIGSVDSGKTKTLTLDVNGPYIYSQTGYSEGDDFKVTVELYDADDDKIDSATKTINV